MSVREIQGHLRELYGIEASPQLISTVTDAVLEEVGRWQSRPLDPLYALVFFDALRVKMRDEGTVRNKAVYLAIGVSPEGRKDVLGIWIEQTEGAKFWLRVMTETDPSHRSQRSGSTRQHLRLTPRPSAGARAPCSPAGSTVPLSSLARSIAAHAAREASPLKAEDARTYFLDRLPSFVIRQVLLVENLRRHLSRGRQSGYAVVAATLSPRSF
jgi:Transposase, Mutator family